MANQPPSRIPLYAPLGSRDASVHTDSRLYNGFAEKGDSEGEVWVYKRPGLQFRAAIGSGAGLGVKNWQNDIYSIFGTTFYKNSTPIGSVDGSGHYTFSACLGATPKLFFHNATFGYTYDDGGGLVQVTDGNYPTPLVPGAAYLDGTNYVLKGANATIYGSEFNDPTTWDPLSFLPAQIEPEAAIALSKQLVYAVVLKQTSTEVFYDAGNAVGSPLGPVQGSKLGVGCRDAGTVTRVGEDLAWIGTTTEGDVQAMLMTKVHGEVISTPPVDRLLKPLDFTGCWAWDAKVSGHRFYVVTLPASNLTLAFDLTSAAWYIWTDMNGNYMPISHSAYDGNGNPILQHATNGRLYNFEAAQYTDDGSAIPVSIYTPPFDGGLRLGKTCAKIEVVGDRDQTSVGIAWSDDDYQTFTAPSLVNLDQDRPWLNDGSTFARRAYLITHSLPTKLRIKALDMTAQPASL